MPKKKITREDLEAEDYPKTKVFKYVDSSLFRSNLSTKQKRNIRKWIKNLKSGEFLQCTHSMCTGKKYDVLGVACVSVGIRPKKTDKGWVFLGSSGFLPEKAVDLLGLRDEEGGSNYFRLNVLNDLNWSFEDLAKLIQISFSLVVKKEKETVNE